MEICGAKIVFYIDVAQQQDRRRTKTTAQKKIQKSIVKHQMIG